jgi:hypothetical protein
MTGRAGNVIGTPRGRIVPPKCRTPACGSREPTLAPRAVTYGLMLAAYLPVRLNAAERASAATRSAIGPDVGAKQLGGLGLEPLEVAAELAEPVDRRRILGHDAPV